MSSAFARGKGAQRRFYVRWRDEQRIWRKQQYAAATLTEAKEEARKREQRAQDIRAGGKRKQKEDITVLDAVYQHYLPDLPPGYASKNSLEGRFRNRILSIKVDGNRAFAELMCREVDGGHVKKVLASNADCSPATREQLRVAIQGLFTYLRIAKRADENPAAEVSKVRIPKRKPRFLKPEQIPRLLEEWPHHRRLHFAFQVGTGGRKQQSLDLEWKDVHEEEGYVLLFGKDNEENLVPLPEWLCLLLRAARIAATSRYVFPKPEGLKGAGGKQPKWVAFHRMMKAALRRAELVDGYDFKCVNRGPLKGCKEKGERPNRGTLTCPSCGQNTLEVVGRPIPITFHNLRSTFATWAYAQTRDIRFVQRVLGHSDTRVTERYAAIVMDHMRIQANRVHLNPFILPADTQNPGTPVGHGKGVTLQNGAQTGMRPHQEPIEETTDA